MDFMDTQQASVPSRQQGDNPTAAPATIPSRYVRFGDFLLDLNREALFRDGARIKLQGKVYQALTVLLEQHGQIVTREMLRVRLWPSGTYVNYDANVNTTVNKLRQILGDSIEKPSYVNTIPRRGYSFVAAVEYVNQAEAPPALSRARLASLTSEGNRASREEASFLRFSLGSPWFTAGIVALLGIGMLVGAGLVLYGNR
jgi:DNA-binding winged helix-turn-helix (wHTH) protein